MQRLKLCLGQIFCKKSSVSKNKFSFYQRTSSSLQQSFFHNVVLELLADKDPRVRSKAAETVVE